jgi:hypothetical protein
MSGSRLVNLLCQSRLLVEFEGIIMIKQQYQYRRAAGMMTMGFGNKQTKEQTNEGKHCDQSYSKPGMNATAMNNTLCLVFSGLKYCEMYFKIKVISQQ